METVKTKAKRLETELQKAAARANRHHRHMQKATAKPLKKQRQTNLSKR
jgi:hypothetical protein